MILRAMIDTLGLRVLCGEAHLHREVAGGYVADMLSDVLAHAALDCVWVTRQAHRNVIAVASLVGLAAVVLVHGADMPADLIDKAEEEQVVVLSTEESAFTVVGRMYSLGLGECQRA